MYVEVSYDFSHFPAMYFVSFLQLDLESDMPRLIQRYPTNIKDLWLLRSED